MACDPALIDSLPDLIKLQIPFSLTRKGGIDRGDQDRLERDLVNGKSLKDMEDTFAELNKRRCPLFLAPIHVFVFSGSAFMFLFFLVRHPDTQASYRTNRVHVGGQSTGNLGVLV